MKWLLRIAVVLVACYAALFSAVLMAMCRPPEQFGQIIKHLPMPLVWGALPASRMWLWAREGTLEEGDPAPDFNLARHDGADRVSLSSHRGQRPVVLVFGSYT